MDFLAEELTYESLGTTPKSPGKTVTFHISTPSSIILDYNLQKWQHKICHTYQNEGTTRSSRNRQNHPRQIQI